MKQNVIYNKNIELFLLKALESKNLNINELVKLSDSDIKKLDLSTMLIEGILEIKERNKIYSTEQVKKDILENSVPVIEVSNDIIELVKNSPVESVDDIEFYKEREKLIVEQQHDILSREELLDDEYVPVLEETIQDVKPVESKVEIVEIPTITINDEKKINKVLQTKELKNASSYLKLLKEELGEEYLKQFNGSIILNIINKRITEVKANETPTTNTTKAKSKSKKSKK